MEETKKKRGRPPKPRFGILSDEQVLALQTPQQIAAAEAREKERLRGIERRKEARAKTQFDAIETREELNDFNLDQVSDNELNALLEKEAITLRHLTWINRAVEGRLTELDPSVEDGAAIIFDFVKQTGTADIELILLGQYWKTDLYRHKFQNGTTPTDIFARTGTLVALPGAAFHRFQQFLATQKATQTAIAPALPAPY
jgi:hypothetical protein